MNSNSNFSTNCTSASSSPSSSPVSFRSAPSPKATQPAANPPASSAIQALATKSAPLSSPAASHPHPHHHPLLANAHLAQQALKHQASVQSLITSHSANHAAHHQLTTGSPVVQAQSMLANMVGNGAADLAAFNSAQFNQFFPTLHHHQFWQNLNDPFYRPFVS